MRFMSTFGQLPRTWLNIILIITSGTTEGLSLALFIPLLHIMDGDKNSEIPRFFLVLMKQLESFGIHIGALTLLASIAAFSMCALGLGYFQRRVLIYAKAEYSFELRNLLFQSFFDSSWLHSSRRPHGEVVNQMTIECNRAGNALGFEVMGVATLILILIFLIFSFTIFWQLSMMAVIFGILMFLVIYPLSMRAKFLGKLGVKINREFSEVLIENLRALKLLKSSASELKAKNETKNKSSKVKNCAADSEINSTKVYFVTQALPALFLTGLIGVSHEILNLSTPVILVFLLFMMRIAPRVGQFQQHVQSYHLNSPAIGVVRELILDNQESLEEKNSEGKIFDGLQNSIILDKITFSYSKTDAPIIKDLSMVIKKKNLVAIVGSSGSGKSTLIDLLTGLQRPCRGSVMVDGLNLDSFQLDSWRKKIGVVTQDTVTFNATLRENLMLFSPDASDRDLHEAVALADLKDTLLEFPEGLNTILGENGARVSGGQKQRIALARALLRKPEILLLDEVTSSLDAETEFSVQEAIFSQSRFRTVVVISHRLSTIRKADIVYVLEEGQMVESGSYKELIALGGRFTELEKIGNHLTE